MQGIYIPDNLSLRSAIDVFLTKKTENVWYWMESLRKNIGKPEHPPPSTWGYNEVHHIDVWYATHPNINPHSHGNPNRKWAATASTRHSVRQGAKASLSTVKDSFLRATGSRPRPARIKITVKAIFLKKKNWNSLWLLYDSNKFCLIFAPCFPRILQVLLRWHFTQTNF